MHYDGAGRLEETIFPDKTSATTHYDAAGEVDWRIDARGNSMLYERPAPGTEIATLQSIAGEPENFTKTVYDGNGNVKEVWDSKGNYVEYLLDGLDRVTLVKFHPAGGGTVITQKETRYDRAIPVGSDYTGVVSGRVELDADQKQTFFGYDGLGRLKVVRRHAKCHD
jgi:hypothetical protein